MGGEISHKNLTAERKQLKSEIEGHDATQPQLIVCIDVEEDFDWSKPFSREGFGLNSIFALPTVVRTLRALGVTPVLLVDYPVLNDEAAVAVLKSIRAEAVFGTQLHAWVNPPYEEDLTRSNSYAGNLPKALERQKLEALSDLFEHVFGKRPTVFRSGRYGFGPNTAEILLDLGYEIDLSHFANRDFSFDGGPDFSNIGPTPFNIDALFCIPVTSGFLGPLRSVGARILTWCDTPLGRALHLRGVLERLGLMGWTWLSPEGVRLRSAISLTQALVRQGQHIFVVSFHSPSLAPGNTSYVKDLRDKNNLEDWIYIFVKFFEEEMGGAFATPHQVKETWQKRDC